MRFWDGGETSYYFIGDNIRELNDLWHRVIGIKGDSVTCYKFISFRDAVYREFCYRDRFTNHRLRSITFM